MAATVLAGALLCLLVTVTFTDLRRRVIPDPALALAAAAGLGLLALDDPGTLPSRLGWSGAAGGFLLAAALVKPEGMGLGDVKLAAVLGLYLGPGVVGALVVALAAGALAGTTIVIRSGWSARARTIPFAPCLALGALAVLL